MKSIILPFCAVFMFCTLAVAQQPQSPQPAPVPQPIGENYVLTLTITDKEQTETKITLVVASANFKTDFLDSKLNVGTFQGLITSNDGGTVSVNYALGGSIAVPTSREPNASINYKTITTQTTVCLKLDEPVQIIKADDRTCTLKISKLSAQQGNGK